MYNMIKEYINRGGYKLRDAQQKIDKLWVMGNLTDEQRVELLDMVRTSAQAANEVDLFAKIVELEERIKALEAAGEDGDNELTPDEYVPGRWYYRGDKITFNSAVYECCAPESVVCTWSPAEYPAYWKWA